MGVIGIPPSAVVKEGADIAKRTPKNTGSALHSEPRSAANDAKNFVEQRARAAGSSATAFEADKKEKEGGVGPRPEYGSYNFLKSKGLYLPKDDKPDSMTSQQRADLDRRIKDYNDEGDAIFAEDTAKALAAKAAKAAKAPPPPPKDEAPSESDEEAPPPPPVAPAAREPRERKQTNREDPSLQNSPPPAASNMARLREFYKEIEGAEIQGNPFLKNGRFNARSEYGKWWSKTIHGPDAAKHQATRKKIDARHDAGKPTKYSMTGLGKPKRGRSSGSAGSSSSDSDSEMKGTGKAKAPWQVAGSQAAKDRMADLRAKRGRTG
jgi:hypothetical protein